MRGKFVGNAWRSHDEGAWRFVSRGVCVAVIPEAYIETQTGGKWLPECDTNLGERNIRNLQGPGNTIIGAFLHWLASRN